MNRILTFLSLIALFAFVLMVANAHAAEPISTGWDRSYEVSEILQAYVMNPQGQYLGRINDLVFDSEGHISFAILARPGILGIHGKLVAIPFNALSYKNKEKHFVLDASRERLEGAPVFTKKDLGDRKWAEDVYRYFGQQPYWTEGGFKGGTVEEYPFEYEYIHP